MKYQNIAARILLRPASETPSIENDRGSTQKKYHGQKIHSTWRLGEGPYTGKQPTSPGAPMPLCRHHPLSLWITQQIRGLGEEECCSFPNWDWEHASFAGIALVVLGTSKARFICFGRGMGFWGGN